MNIPPVDLVGGSFTQLKLRDDAACIAELHRRAASRALPKNRIPARSARD
jgi:hypothetical protein